MDMNPTAHKRAWLRDTHLVFYENACKASPGKAMHCALDAEGVPEACVAIPYDWQRFRSFQYVPALHCCFLYGICPLAIAPALHAAQACCRHEAMVHGKALPALV